MKAAKFLVGLVGAVAEAVVQLALGGVVQQAATIVVALATAIGVYAWPNAQPAGSRYAGRLDS
jgi:hypothetical protein